MTGQCAQHYTLIKIWQKIFKIFPALEVCNFLTTEARIKRYFFLRYSLNYLSIDTKFDRIEQV